MDGSALYKLVGKFLTDHGRPQPRHQRKGDRGKDRRRRQPPPAGRKDGPPVERRDVALNANFKVGSQRLVDVSSNAEYRYVYFGNDFGEIHVAKAGALGHR